MSKVKSATQNLKVFNKIYKVVKKIPKGKVATYGQIAELVNSSTLGLREKKEPRNRGTEERDRKKVAPRVVGFALHANKDRETPCHRVVNRDGRLAPNFAFNGAKEQRNRLLEEGVKFKDKMHVDLSKCQWHFAANPKHEIRNSK